MVFSLFFLMHSIRLSTVFKQKFMRKLISLAKHGKHTQIFQGNDLDILDNFDYICIGT